MRQDTYCSFEVSKLLKEKGFDGLCACCYKDGNLKTIWDDTFGEVRPQDWNNLSEERYNCISLNSWFGCISAPTHQMAMQWLRDEHDILITVLPDKIHDTIALFWNVYIVTEKEYKWIFAGGGVNMTYEELIEEALLYALKTLIN